jgi:hypothetical protein
MYYLVELKASRGYCVEVFHKQIIHLHPISYCRILAMVYNFQRYLVFGLYPSSKY